MSKSARRAPPPPDAPPPSAAPPSAPPRRRFRWRRWLLGLLVAVVLLRIALAFAVPIVVRSSLESAGLRADWERLSLSLVGGSVEFEGLQLRPKADAEAAAAADAPEAVAPLKLDLVRVNVGMLPLLSLDYRVEDVTLTGLRAVVRLTQDGQLVIAGLPLGGEAAAEPAEPPAPAEPAASPPPLFGLAHLALTDITVEWSDETVQPPVATLVHLDLTGEDLQWGPGAQSGHFDLALSAPGECERLGLAGSFRGDPDDLELEGELQLRDLRDGPLSRYLPPGIRNELRAGQADARIAASWKAAEPGGSSAKLELSGFELKDADTRLLAFDRLSFAAPRLDAGRGDFEIDELLLSGLAGRARVDAGGTLHVVGLALAPGPAELPQGSALDATPPVAGEVGADRAGGEAPAAPAEERNNPPRVTLQRLDLEVAELALVDEQQPGGAPLVVGLRLQNRDPLFLLDAVPESLPPLRLLLTGHVQPVAGDIQVEIEATPWQAPATLVVSLDVGGLRGEGLTELRPALLETLDGSGLREGRLSAALHVEVDARRRGPAHYDWSQGFGVRLQLDDLALRDAPEGQLLVGLKGLELDAPRIDLDGGLVQIRALELDTPQAALRQDAQGISLAGLRLLPAPAAGATGEAGEAGEAREASAVAAEPLAAEPAASPPVAPPGTPPPPGTEVRVDRFAIHGLDLAWRDETTAPTTVFVLNSLELDVRHFTTLAFVEPKAIRFRVDVGAGEIELPRRTKASSSLLAGLASAAALAVVGSEETHEVEMRPAFGELSASGTLRLAPAPTGRVRVGLSSFELLSLAGLSSSSGVQIGDGLLDATLDMRLRGEQGVDVSARLVFSDLSLSEPADGPISTYLNLPAPLDSVLYLLRNERGEQRIAFEVSQPPEGVGGGKLLSSAGQAIGEVVGRAVAAVPARLVTSVTDLTGMTGGEEGPPLPLMALAFAPGSTALPDVSLKDLRNTLTKLLANGDAVLLLEHHLGHADLQRADQLGNPPAEECERRGAELRQQRSELLRRQAECSAEARAMLLVGRVDESESARGRLLEAERELCLTEAALDDVYERLRPGAERFRTQRTRTAALQIGDARLQAVLQALLALGLPGVEGRIELKPARLEPIEGEGGGVVTATLKGG